jgi:hypothetical protein
MPTPPEEILAVVSDVDGTLVTDDKVLTQASRSAVARLRESGIAFAIVSSRPPRGLAALIAALKITTPVAGFNGAVIASPDLAILERRLLAPAIASRAVEQLAGRGVDVWVFSGGAWLVRDADGPEIGREIRTVGFEPTLVSSFGPALDAAAKIVGVSDDFPLLARCETELAAELAGRACAVRSQRYYLDITDPLANKAQALRAIAARLAIPLSRIAVIGDGRNDMAMFTPAGLSIAMGNAEAEVQAAADFVTAANGADGFAEAIDRLILAGDRSRVRAAAPSPSSGRFPP